MLILGSDIIANQYTADAVFGNNSWAVIKAVCQAGAIPASWAVGDTKTITGTDGKTYTIRLSDKQAGRHNYASGGLTTHAVFELLEVPTQTLQWNSSNTNSGGYANSLIRKNLNNYEGATATTKIIDLLPDDLKNALVEVKVKSSTGGSSYTGQSESANKIFLLAYNEVSTTSTQQYIDETINNGTTYGVLDYYVAHSASADRKKNGVGTTSAQSWWLRSPSAGNTNYVFYVSYNGSMSNINANLSYGASFGFAF